MREAGRVARTNRERERGRCETCDSEVSDGSDRTVEDSAEGQMVTREEEKTRRLRAKGTETPDFTLTGTTESTYATKLHVIRASGPALNIDGEAHVH